MDFVNLKTRDTKGVLFGPDVSLGSHSLGGPKHLNRDDEVLFVPVVEIEASLVVAPEHIIAKILVHLVYLGDGTKACLRESFALTLINDATQQRLLSII